MNANNAVHGDAHWTRRCPEKVPRGENHPRAALRGMLRESAVEMIAAGYSVRHVARELGVSRRAVENATRVTLPAPSSAPGSPFRITEHAIDRYIERIRPGISRDRALRDLVAITRGAHPVKEIEPGLWLWRGPKPRRIRLRVSTREPGLPQIVTVLTTYDGFGSPE